MNNQYGARELAVETLGTVALIVFSAWVGYKGITQAKQANEKIAASLKIINATAAPAANDEIHKPSSAETSPVQAAAGEARNYEALAKLKHHAFRAFLVPLEMPFLGRIGQYDQRNGIPTEPKTSTPLEHCRKNTLEIMVFEFCKSLLRSGLL